MRAYGTDREIIQNLADAGCDSETISSFMECREAGNQQEQLGLLAKHRESLLASIHREQREIDCLDYLVYQMRRK